LLARTKYLCKRFTVRETSKLGSSTIATVLLVVPVVTRRIEGRGTCGRAPTGETTVDRASTGDVTAVPRYGVRVCVYGAGICALCMFLVDSTDRGGRRREGMESEGAVVGGFWVETTATVCGQGTGAEDERRRKCFVKADKGNPRETHAECTAHSHSTFKHYVTSTTRRHWYILVWDDLVFGGSRVLQ
jgi:hypothetical protein